MFKIVFNIKHGINLSGFLFSNEFVFLIFKINFWIMKNLGSLDKLSGMIRSYSMKTKDFIVSFINILEKPANQWQNIMGILKSVFKTPPLPPIQCCETITLLEASFAHCSSTLLRGGRTEKHKIVQIAVFPIIFVADCLKNLQNLKWGILELLILSRIEGMHLLIMSLLYKSE